MRASTGKASLEQKADVFSSLAMQLRHPRCDFLLDRIAWAGLLYIYCPCSRCFRQALQGTRKNPCPDKRTVYAAGPNQPASIRLVGPARPGVTPAQDQTAAASRRGVGPVLSRSGRHLREGHVAWLRGTRTCCFLFLDGHQKTFRLFPANLPVSFSTMVLLAQ